MTEGIDVRIKAYISSLQIITRSKCYSSTTQRTQKPKVRKSS